MGCQAVEANQRLAGKQVLVTGARGFIGTHLCRRLCACRSAVHGVSRRLYYAHDGYLQSWQVDLTDVASVRQILRSVQPEIIFHLASHVAGARERDLVLPTFYDNLASTVHLLTACAETGCRRIVLASSCDEPRNYSGETFPCSPYAAAKWASTMYGRMSYRLFETPVVMARIFMTYGPDQKDQKKLVPFVVNQLLRGEAPQLTSGQRLADWIYVEDVVEGLLRAATAPGIDGCEFDLGSGSLTSVRQVVEQIVELVGTGIEPLFGALSDRPFEQERAADTTFLSDRLGYQPQTSLKQGLAATIDWHRRKLCTSHA